jgi:signal transduction histidine kinase
LHVGINSAADIVNVRMKARDLAVDLGFDEPGLNLITSAVSEMASHIANHAKSGEVVLSPGIHGDRRGLTMVAHDEVPGLKDRGTAMQFGCAARDDSGTGRPRSSWRQAEFELRTFADRQREEQMLGILSRKILQAEEAERRRISRELRPRVQSVHGQFVIRPEPGRGTTVRITIPFSSRTSGANVFNQAKEIVYEKNSSAAGRRPHGRPPRLAHVAGDRSGNYGGRRSRNGPPSLGFHQAPPP